MKLVADYNWRNGPEARELLESALTDRAMNLIGKVAQGPVEETSADSKAVEDLFKVRALRREKGKLYANVPIILKSDTSRLKQACTVFSGILVDEIVRSANLSILEDHPMVKTPEDRLRYAHFLTKTVTLGWQGHEMLTRLERIPPRAENTDEKGRWYLLRFFEPLPEQYSDKKTGGGGSYWGTEWSISNAASTIESNILTHFGSIVGSVSEDEYDIQNSFVEVLVDGLADYAASNGTTNVNHKDLSERLGLERKGRVDALVFDESNFEAPRAFIRAIYEAMERFWLEYESAINEVLDELTPAQHGIDHRHMYHWAWGNIVGSTYDALRERGYLVDLTTLPNRAINAFWKLNLNLQSTVLSD